MTGADAAALVGIDPAWMVSATAFAISMAATPGPNNAMLTASGSLWGLRRTVPHLLGICVGFPVMLVAVAVGLGAPLSGNTALLTVLRWVGAAYLLWLAWKIGTAHPTTSNAPSAEAARPRAGGRPFTFLQAALFQWVNPKAWIIVLSALGALATAGGEPSLPRAFGLAGVFMVVNVPVALLWTLMGVGVARVLRTPRALRRFNVTMALLLVGSMVPILLGSG